MPQYTLRWRIELPFEACKSIRGMLAYRFMEFARGERWIDPGGMSSSGGCHLPDE